MEREDEERILMMNFDDLDFLTQDDDLAFSGGEDIDLMYALMFGDTSTGPEESLIEQPLPPLCQTESMELEALAILLALGEC
jgi:hypothetical protein